MFLGSDFQTGHLTICPSTALEFAVKLWTELPVQPWSVKLQLLTTSSGEPHFGIPVEKLEACMEDENDGATQQSSLQDWFGGCTTCGEVEGGPLPTEMVELKAILKHFQECLYLVEFPKDMKLEWILGNIAQTANLHPLQGYGAAFPLPKVDREYVMEAPFRSLDAELLESLATTSSHQTYVVQLLCDYNPGVPVVLHEACRMVPLFKDNELCHPLWCLLTSSASRALGDLATCLMSTDRLVSHIWITSFGRLSRMPSSAALLSKKQWGNVTGGNRALVPDSGTCLICLYAA